MVFSCASLLFLLMRHQDVTLLITFESLVPIDTTDQRRSSVLIRYKLKPSDLNFSRLQRNCYRLADVASARRLFKLISPVFIVCRRNYIVAIRLTGIRFSGSFTRGKLQLAATDRGFFIRRGNLDFNLSLKVEIKTIEKSSGTLLGGLIAELWEKLAMWSSGGNE